MAKSSRNELLQGTLDVLILKPLALGSDNGWGISKRIRQMSADEQQVNHGSLYPSLHRLEELRWIEAEWGLSDNNRQAKFYRLTRAGEKHLARETESWAQVSVAVTRILQTN